MTSVFKKKTQNAEVLLSLSDFCRTKGEKKRFCLLFAHSCVAA